MYNRNEMIELSFHGEEPEGSWIQVDLEAVIIGPDSRKIIKGFYAGNATYKVRFLPETAGLYEYEITGVVQAKGFMQVEEAKVDCHGVVRADGCQLRHQDGRHFVGFGTTVYALANQSEELIDETIKTLSSAPFNKVRMCVFPKHYNYNHNEPNHYAFQLKEGKEGSTFSEDLIKERLTENIWNVNKPDFAFWDAFERRMNQLFNLGIQVDLILFHPYDRWGFSSMNREDSLAYLDYVVRRFAAYPNIWWSLANEYDLFAFKNEADWDAFGMFLQQNDPYHHLIGNHNCFTLFDPAKEFITHVSVQTHSMNRVAEFMQKYKKPVCYDECCYEGNLNENWGNISGKEMTRRFWQATVTGGHCTHGETYLDPKLAYDNTAVVWWARGGRLIGESPKRIAFLRELIESLPGTLEPMSVGIGDLMGVTEEKREEIRTRIQEMGSNVFLEALMDLTPAETQRFIDMDFEYAGRVEDKVFLYYLDHHTCARKMLPLPEGKSCKIEVIDTWNMTREVYAENAMGKGPQNMYEIILNGNEWMAILVTVNN